MSKAFLVIGATGKQGGALIRSLIEQPGFGPTKHTIYGVTRDIFSGSARRMAGLSPAIKPIQGDLGDPAGIFAQLDPKPTGVFIVHPVDNKETEHCNALIDEAVRNDAKHIIFCSVDRGPNSDSDPTNVPHFITKYHVELHLKEQAAKSGGALTYTILRPVFFLDNLLPGFFGKFVATEWKSYLANGQELQVVDTNDIGAFAALAFWNPDGGMYRNKSISLAGDALTFEQANAIWMEKTGAPMPTTYGLLVTAANAVARDLRLMFEWFASVGYKADIAALNAVMPMTTFRDWVDREIVKHS